MKIKLYRDKVISVIDDWEGIVGVYIKLPKNSGIFELDDSGNKAPVREFVLGEFTPKKADAIIKLWNNKIT